eukprot:15070926-Alexandrium_andersonii.AAC.1
MLARMATFLQQFASPFVVAADWNIALGELWKTGWAQRLAARIVAPPVACACTAGCGRILDVYMCARSLRPLLVGPVACLQTPWTPHL